MTEASAVQPLVLKLDLTVTLEPEALGTVIDAGGIELIGQLLVSAAPGAVAGAIAALTDAGVNVEQTAGASTAVLMTATGGASSVGVAPAPA